MVGRRAEANEALSHAFARRDRVPEQERYYISYRYYVGRGEVRKAIEVSETWAGVYPRTWTPHDNLCKLNWQLWNTERALAECREAIRLDPGSIYPYEGLIEFSMALGKMDEARSAAAGLLAAHLNDARAHGYLARIAWVQDDDKEWQRESAWLRDKAAREYARLEFERRLAEGRLGEAAKGRPVDLLTMAVVGRVKEARDGAEQVLREWRAKRAQGPIPATAVFAVSMSGPSDAGRGDDYCEPTETSWRCSADLQFILEAALSDTMSWFWIAVALVLPFGLAVLVAWPFWGRSRDSLGSAVGALFIFAFAVAFIGREYIHLQKLTGVCIAAEKACSFHPEPFTRFSIYAFISMAQVGALFALSGAVEHRIENASFAKDWRR